MEIDAPTSPLGRIGPLPLLCVALVGSPAVVLITNGNDFAAGSNDSFLEVGAGANAILLQDQLNGKGRSPSKFLKNLLRPVGRGIINCNELPAIASGITEAIHKGLNIGLFIVHRRDYDALALISHGVLRVG